MTYGADDPFDLGREPWLPARAARSPGAEALRFEGRSISYAELAREVAELAASLEESGVVAGEVVAALLLNTPGSVRLLHALRTIGAVLLPLSPRASLDELAHQLKDSGARALVVESGALAQVGREAVRGCTTTSLLTLWHTRVELAERARDAVASGSLHAERRALLEGALALLYTSGTTGRPKGAILSAAAFRASAAGSARLLGASPRDRWLVCMPLFHVGGLSILLRSVLVGSSAVVQPRFDPVAVDRALESEGVSMISLVANMLSRLLEVRGDRPAPASLRCVLLGGGPTPEDLLRRAQDLGFPIAVTYGLTEAASQVATRPPGSGASPLAAGLQALPGTRIAVVDEAGAPLPAGEAGEIRVRGPTLMSGYLGNDAASRAALRDGWLHTGDIGRLDEAGRLQILDRRDDLIISGGENVYPAEVESVLLAHPSVVEAAVVARADPRFGARPVAHVVIAGVAPTSEELAAHCRQRLAAFKVPIDFIRADALPRSHGGKLLRRRLREA